MPDFFLISNDFDFQVTGSPRLLIWLSSMSQSEAFYFCGIFFRKSLILIRAVVSWRTGSAGKCCWSWHASIFKVKFLSCTWFIFPSKCQAIAFIWGRLLVFWKSWNLSSTRELESWLRKSGKRLPVLRYLDVPTRPSRKLQRFEFFYHIWIESDIYYRWIPGGTVSACVP